MIFTPKKLGSKTLDRPTLSVDKKFSKHFGPCAIGDEALYLNSFYIDRYYYVALSCVKRVFKRVAMSKGGFTGKGVFGSIPYLVVELDDGTAKQCNFKWENDVDMMIAHISKLLPDLPTHSVEAERRLKEKKAREEARYLKELSVKAQESRETLETARRFLDSFPEETTQLSTAAKAKRVNERTNPAYRWVALTIILAGVIALSYGIYVLVKGDKTGLYFALLGFGAAFLFSGTQVIPTAKNNKKAVNAQWEDSIKTMESLIPENFPVPARYAHPVVLDRMVRVIREGRAQSVKEALAVVKEDLKKLDSSVQVDQEEYDEVVAIKPMFLCQDYP